MIFVDSQHRVIKHSKFFPGTLSRIEVHPRKIVREVIRVNASAVIPAHNYPSGYAESSKAGRFITERVVKCCRFMDIRVLDRLVIGCGEHVSFVKRDWI